MAGSAQESNNLIFPMLDLSCTDDLDDLATCITDPRLLLAQAIARRLQTPEGTLTFHPNYGFDLRAHLNMGFTKSDLARLEQRIRAECLKEPDVGSAKVRIEMNESAMSMRVFITLSTAGGDVSMYLTVTRDSLDLES